MSVVETTAAASPALPPGSRSAPRSARRITAALRELALVASLYTLYRVGRVITAPGAQQAKAHAHSVWSWERTLHLPPETGLADLFLRSESIGRAASAYYATVHLPLTAAVLVWLWLRRPAVYRWTRTTLVLLTGASLVIEIAFPLAPPRMMTDLGFVDLGRRLGLSVYGPPAADHLANQYAAMPSLHIGWAVLVAITMATALHGRWRWLWFAHPVITLLVVVGTANHYWADGIVVLLLLGVALLATRRLRPSDSLPPLRAAALS